MAPARNPHAPTLANLQCALHRLDATPDGPGWNHAELDGLLATNASSTATPTIAAAVLVGMVPREGGLHILLTLRNEDMRHHPGQVSFPGGRIETSDASPAAAAIREAGEEIGLAPAQIEPLGYLDPLATISGFRVLPLVAIINPDYCARPDPVEVAEVFEVPLAWLLTPDNLAQVRIQAAGRPRSVLQFVDRGSPRHRIWGATASILLNLRQRLGSTG